MKILLFLLSFSVICFSQSTLRGRITNNQNRGIESASVVVLDEYENAVAYTFSDENGAFEIKVDVENSVKLKLSVSALSYFKKTVDIKENQSLFFNVMLDDNSETLKEVVIESDKKIRINQDTTSIKVASFGNKTEQTVEDILKKLPGIEVLKDGTIKAHGKPIDKLLIEGEDMFDKNYKILSKNLDAKVLDVVQIIDHFEDNPIFKKLSNSEKVAINLKLKKDKQNIWFGNITAGAGVVSENRWKEGLNIGLLKKKIKLFYLADFNNSGEKATDQIKTSQNENNNFAEDIIEKKTSSLFSINSNEIANFNKSQTIFNDAFLNSISFNRRLNDRTKLRGVAYGANDFQKQDAFSRTLFNIESPIENIETSQYNSNYRMASAELELKIEANEKNYFSNLSVFNVNNKRTGAKIIFNTNNIFQNSQSDNSTFYNHFNHSLLLPKNRVLNNYIYFGFDDIKEKSKVVSEELNNFFNVDNKTFINQNLHNTISFIGIKSKFISKYAKIEHVLSTQIETQTEKFKNQFLADNIEKDNFQTNAKIILNTIKIGNVFRYNFSKLTNIEAVLNASFIHLKINARSDKLFVFQPSLGANFRKTIVGNIAIQLSENNDLPENKSFILTNQLRDYRTFSVGNTFQGLLKSQNASISQTFFNDSNRYSISNTISYTNQKSILNTENNLNNSFSFERNIRSVGGEIYNYDASFVNFFKFLNTATKISTNQNWSSNFININSATLEVLKSYNNKYSFSATTYFKIPINFDFGLNYTYNQSIFQQEKNNNEIQDFFFNGNYNITNTLILESNNSFFLINNTYYTFLNAVANYNPINSRFSYRLVCNNALNEREFSLVSLSTYAFSETKINLVPRFLLMTIKYRF